MQDDTERFWQDLRARMRQANPPDLADDVSMEEAERRMAAAGETPFSREEIDSMVHSATADDPPRPHTVETPAPAPRKRGVILKLNGWTKAAAVLLGLLFLYSVTDFTMEDSPRPPRSSYSVSVGELLDAQIEEGVRASAQTRLYLAARDSIGALKDVQQGGGVLREDAERHLAELLRELRSDEVPSAETLPDLVENLDEPVNPQPGTRSELAVHANRARSAIRVLRAARTDAVASALLAEGHLRIVTLLEGAILR